LTFGHTITHVVDLSWWSSSSYLRTPVLYKRPKNTSHIVLSDHLNSVTVGLTPSSVSTAKSIVRDCKSSHRRLLAAWRCMGHIGADEECWCRKLARKTAGLVWDSLGCGTTELGIEFHQHVGIVLRVALLDLSGLENLRYYAESLVARLLDAEIVVSITVLDDEDEDLGSHLEVVAGPLEKLVDSCTRVIIELHSEGLVIGDETAMTSVGFDEIHGELLDGTLAELGPATEEANTPRDEFFGVWVDKLLGSEIPATFEAWLFNLILEFDGGRWQDTSLGYELLVIDLQPVL